MQRDDNTLKNSEGFSNDFCPLPKAERDPSINVSSGRGHADMAIVYRNAERGKDDTHQNFYILVLNAASVADSPIGRTDDIQSMDLSGADKTSTNAHSAGH